jgi:hypothetical protein
MELLRSCYVFTYLFTPWGTVLLEKLTGSAASQEVPRIFERKIPSPYPQVPATCPYPEPTPSSPHNPPPNSEIHLTIPLPSTPGSPQCALSLRKKKQKPVHASPLPINATCPPRSHSYRFYHPHKIECGVQNIKLLIL